MEYMNNAQQRPLIKLCFCSPSASIFFISFVAYIHITTNMKNIRSLVSRFTVHLNLRSLNGLFTAEH